MKALWSAACFGILIPFLVAGGSAATTPSFKGSSVSEVLGYRSNDIPTHVVSNATPMLLVEFVADRNLRELSSKGTSLFVVPYFCHSSDDRSGPSIAGSRYLYDDLGIVVDKLDQAASPDNHGYRYHAYFYVAWRRNESLDQERSSKDPGARIVAAHTVDFSDYDLRLRPESVCLRIVGRHLSGGNPQGAAQEKSSDGDEFDAHPIFIPDDEIRRSLKQ